MNMPLLSLTGLSALCSAHPYPMVASSFLNRNFLLLQHCLHQRPRFLSVYLALPSEGFTKNSGTPELDVKTSPVTKNYRLDDSKLNLQNQEAPCRRPLTNGAAVKYRSTVKGTSGLQKTRGDQPLAGFLKMAASCAPTPYGYFSGLHYKGQLFVRPPPY